MGVDRGLRRSLKGETMKKRPLHKWNPNKRNTRPRKVIFVDVESDFLTPIDGFEQHTLRLGWACFQRRWGENFVHNPQWLYFDKVPQFWDFVEKHSQPKTKLWIVGHGLAYDLGILELVATAKQKDWKRTFSYYKGSNCMITYKTPKGSLTFISTTNLFSGSLEDLGKLVGVEKKSVDFRNVNDETLSDYCRRDVEIVMKLWEVWLEFLDTHDLGDFKGTIASQAFAAYRHRFMPTDVWIHGDMDVCKLERESYRGGRSEVFRQGNFPEGDYYKLDVNGLYGYVMETGTFPCDLKGHFTHVNVDLLQKMVKNYALVARVRIQTDIPVFPVKMNGVNAYPVGTFETVLTTPELLFALEHCQILEVKEIAAYQSYPLFKDYAAYFSLLKEEYSKERNKAFRMIAKLFNNALYGKLAQRDYKAMEKSKKKDGKTGNSSKSRLKTLLDLSTDLIHTVWEKWGQLVWGNEPSRTLPTNCKLVRNEKWSVKELLGKKPRMKKVTFLGCLDKTNGFFNAAIAFTPDYMTTNATEESYNSFPAISAHVTAYARLYLWELMVQAGRENVFYCDTDGFVCNRRGYENCLTRLDPYKAGSLKVEDQSPNLTIFRRKGYVMGGERTICGIRDNAIELEPLVFEQDEFLGVPGAIRQGNPDKRGVSRVVKHVSTEIKGGIVGQDGWVIPFHLVDRKIA